MLDRNPAVDSLLGVMRAPVIIFSLCFGLLVGCASPAARMQAAKDDAWQVWMTANKGFGGPIYYVGSDDQFAYFRLGSWHYHYYKTHTKNTKLPQHFSLGAGTPYLVDQSMIVGDSQ